MATTKQDLEYEASEDEISSLETFRATMGLETLEEALRALILLGLEATTMSDSRDDEERRRAVRRKTIKSAQLVFNNRNSTVSGLVSNLSETGARFVVNAPVNLPGEVQLRFPDGEERNAEIEWNKDQTIFGLRFV